MRKKTNPELIAYAIGTEVDAVHLYSFILKRVKGEAAKTIAHILKEEIDHLAELYDLLSKEMLDA